MIPYDDDPRHLTLNDLAWFLVRWMLIGACVIAFVVGWLSGCAGRKPRVYNDTCDLCITRPLPLPKQPPRPRPPAPKPRGPFYFMAFDRPHLDCVEVDHKLDTRLRKWACATKDGRP